MKPEIIRTEDIPEAERMERADDRPPIGSWWWLADDEPSGDPDKDKYDRPGLYFACVIEVGSNYVKLESMKHKHRRALDGFYDKATAEPNPQEFITSKVNQHREGVRVLMGKIQEVCRKLGIPMQQALAQAAEVSTALAVTHGVADVKKYEKALVKAKDKTLPELFEKVKEQHKAMAAWMKMELTPLEAALDQSKGVVEIINHKIHTVELYAGLQEQLVQVREGSPAPEATKVHLLQERLYMDEECLVKYEAGGMDFEDIGKFDKWLARAENMRRLLPHDRCIVAFRIRRYDRDYGIGDSLSAFIKFGFHNQYNKATFLYIRNGQQLWRMRTSIEFDAELFPNREDSELLGDDELWFQAGGVDLYKVISGRTRLGMIEAWKERRHDLARELWAWKRAGKPEGDWIMPGSTVKGWTKAGYVVGGQSGMPSEHISDDWKRFKRVTPESIYFDDVMKKISAEAFQHNRIAVIVQGLLDRSTCLHPHPPWKIWTAEGFAAGIELVYTSSRMLAPLTRPDWEGYFAQLGKSIKPGAMTLGQYPIWKEEMKARYDKEWHWRAGDGPARIARVHALRGGKARFDFTRSRRKGIRYTEPVPGEPGWVYKRVKYPDIAVSWWCATDKLFCVNAYTPGDFHIFFDDPRTRAEYIKWAPYLLSAEDWHHARRAKPDHDETDDAADVESEED